MKMDIYINNYVNSYNYLQKYTIKINILSQYGDRNMNIDFEQRR